MDEGERLEKTLAAYKKKYFSPIRGYWKRRYAWSLQERSREKIYDKIKDICMSMKSSEYLRLPNRIDNNIMIDLPESARKKYGELEDMAELNFNGSNIKASNAGVLANNLLQMANGAVYDDMGSIAQIHDAKLEALDDVIEAANGKPVLVFYNFRHDLLRISNHLKGKAFRALKTSEDIGAWNRGEIPIMLAHPASAGHGLNLQHGGNIILMVWA